ncbi:phosphatase PAP2 family protein [Phytoactinopolyspora halotolerans]|uniref:Phosphatase PAP2 family protein n=1 Tax=Phytoactinopolyspora halotolerans TaxID=1981512 RepID=A0A6L9S2Q9_9ACTN|nr:phosphatase PAP2 family protein [Phytoactinopolyspora halotolerans]NED98903.1 phosphatase PAP2 family protein [Phytoactinopolyspora halotolerans]
MSNAGPPSPELRDPSRRSGSAAVNDTGADAQGSDDSHRGPRARPWWLAPALTGVLSAALLAFMTWQVVERGFVIDWDWPFHEYVDARQPEGVARELLDGVASLGGQRLYTLPIVVAVGVWVAWKQRKIRVLIAVGSGLATVFFIGYWIKFSLARTAPHTGMDILHGDGQAFPSGHTANATLTWFLIATILFGAHGWRPDRRRFRQATVAACVIVFLAGALMALLDYHWLSDIPGGWLLGALALSVANAVLRVRLPWPILDWPSTRSSQRH